MAYYNAVLAPPCHVVVCAGLLSLKSAIINGPASLVSAINTSWSDVWLTPCHDLDPACLSCSVANCSLGGIFPGATPLPAYYCNAATVACKDGRVVNISLSGYTGLVLSQLPTEVNQLGRLQELGRLREARMCISTRMIGPTLLRLCHIRPLPVTSACGACSIHLTC